MWVLASPSDRYSYKSMVTNVKVVEHCILWIVIYKNVWAYQLLFMADRTMQMDAYTTIHTINKYTHTRRNRLLLALQTGLGQLTDRLKYYVLLNRHYLNDKFVTDRSRPKLHVCTIQQLTTSLTNRKKPVSSLLFSLLIKYSILEEITCSRCSVIILCWSSQQRVSNGISWSFCRTFLLH